MSAGAIRAGKAFVELYGDKSKLVRTLQSASKDLKAWGASIAGIGAKVFAAGSALTAPFIAAAKTFSDFGSQLGDMSGRTGASVEALSTLKYAADQTGASVEDLETALKKQGKTIGDAALGSQTSAEALGHLGLSVQQLMSLKPEDQFRLIASRLAAVKNPALKAAVAMEIFGKSGTKVLPMIADLGNLENAARALGLEMSTEDSAAAHKLGDAWTDLTSVMKMAAFHVGAAVAPALQAVTEAGTRVVAWTANWISQNRELIAAVFKVGVIVAGVGAALIALGTVIAGLGFAIGAVVTIGGVVVSVFGAIAAGVAFLISPVGLVIAGLVALGVWFFRCTEAGQAAVGWLIDVFSDLKDQTLATFGGIKDALAAGDISLAAEVLWSSLKLVWLKGTTFLTEHWLEFKADFMSIAVEAFFGVLQIANDAWAGIQKGWITTVAVLKTGMAQAQGFIADRMLDVMGLFDKTLDVADAQKTRAEDTNRNVAGIEQNKNQALADAAKTRGGREDAITAANVAAKEDLNRKRLADAAGLGAELAQAQKDFEDARGRAATAAAKATGLTKTPGKTGGLEFDPLTQGLSQAKTAVSGTFSAAAARGLGNGNQLDQIVVATQQTAKATQRIAKKKGGIPVT